MNPSRNNPGLPARLLRRCAAAAGRLRIAPAVLLMLLASAPALACKYAVRDVGFVALNDKPFVLTLVLPDGTTDDAVDALKSEAQRLVSGSPFVIQAGRPSDGGGFAPTTAVDAASLPAVVLTDPTDRTAVVHRGPLSVDALPGLLGPLLDSPTRSGLADDLITGYATVLLVEGTDAQQNAQARRTVEQAIARIDRNKARFDRKLEIGPSLRIIRASQRNAERWLLWTLQIDVTPQQQPEVAILFGQGRRLGPVLQGASLTEPKLYTHLAIVAQDCECDLDRGWLYGRRFPLRWTDDHRARAYTSLGFDPESALVRAEVARIISRGSAAGPGDADPFIDNGGIAGLGLQVYELGGAEPTQANNAPAADAGAADAADAASSDRQANASSVPGTAAEAAAAPVSGDGVTLAVLLTLGTAALLIAVGGGVMIARSRSDAA